VDYFKGSSLKAFVEPTSTCIETQSMGKTSHAKELGTQKKSTSHMSNGPPFEIKQHKSSEIGKSIANKNLLKGLEGDV
jgi:hypothetical protein